MSVTFTSVPAPGSSEREQLEARRADLLLEVGKVEAALAALAPPVEAPAAEIPAEPAADAKSRRKAK